MIHKLSQIRDDFALLLIEEKNIQPGRIIQMDCLNQMEFSDGTIIEPCGERLISFKIWDDIDSICIMLADLLVFHLNIVHGIGEDIRDDLTST